jgi:Uma2 family endonuclease
MDTPRIVTEDELMALAATGERYEVVSGQLVEVEVTGEQHGRIEFKLLLKMGNYVVDNNMGTLYPGDMSFVLDGDEDNINILREPDIAFVAVESMKSTEKYLYQAPELAVEIISPSQTFQEIMDKVSEYLQFGVKEVWVVQPKSKRIHVYFANNRFVIYQNDDLLESEIIKGFKLKLGEIFE